MYLSHFTVLIPHFLLFFTSPSSFHLFYSLLSIKPRYFDLPHFKLQHYHHHHFHTPHFTLSFTATTSMVFQSVLISYFRIHASPLSDSIHLCFWQRINQSNQKNENLFTFPISPSSFHVFYSSHFHHLNLDIEPSPFRYSSFIFHIVTITIFIIHISPYLFLPLPFYLCDYQNYFPIRSHIFFLNPHQFIIGFYSIAFWIKE